MTLLLLIATLFLAYANGANDNFKGVATLYASRDFSFKEALSWTSIATGTGGLMAVYLAGSVITAFSGKGLVPDSIFNSQSFSLVVGLAAALTVMLATVFGMPVSTTHALVGSLAGAGIVASESGVNWSKLGGTFFLPLIAGPVLSALLIMIIYPLFKILRKSLKVNQETCLCVGKKVLATVPIQNAVKTDFTSVVVAEESFCKSYYSGSFIGVSVNSIVNTFHFISSGIVCFARGVNDTPKIVALLFVARAFDQQLAILGVALFMVLGGLLHSKKIAVTMGDKITPMNNGQAFSANLVTGVLVLGASKLGLPVSTTHVSCGSIFGIGAINKKINLKTLSSILLAWVTTLPLGFMLSALLMLLMKNA